MNFATVLLPGRVVDALGWTLFHSLWQGALAALAFALVLYLTRQYSARVRYALGLMALLLVLAASVITFFSYYGDPSSGASPTVAVTGAAGAIAAETLPAQAAAPGEPSTAAKIVSFFTDYFGRNLPLFVTLWLLGVLFLTLRFTGGLLYLQRLKYRQSRPLPAPWPEKLLALAARAGLRRPIRMLESLRLRTPVVVGHLKPVLLLPAGLVTGLPADEVEALLAHELAHVLRRDYLVNVLQHVLDILFFFHPGLRWISACVRQEREHCCDDFAVALCGDSRNYARALARLQVEGLGPAEPALAAVGRPQRLLRRIARLLGSPRLAHDFREGFVSALLLVVGLLGVMRMVGSASSSLPSLRDAAQGASLAVAAASPAPAAEAQAASRFALVSFVLEADGLVRLSGERIAGSGGSPARMKGTPQTPGTWLVDDRSGQVIWYMDLASRAQAGGAASFSEEVSLESGAYSWYRPDGWKATAQWKSADGKGTWEPLTMFVGNRDRLLGRRGAGDEPLLKEKEMEQALLKAEQEKQQLLLQRAESERKAREEERLQAEELRAREEAKRAMSEDERRRIEEELRAQAEAEQNMKEEEKQKYEQELRLEEEQKRLEAEEQQRLQREKQELRVQKKRLKAEEEQRRSEMRKFTQFFQDLVKKGIVSRANRYEIKLSASLLVINGKVQSPDVHKKLKSFYESLTGKKLDEKHLLTVANDPE